MTFVRTVAGLVSSTSTAHSSAAVSQDTVAEFIHLKNDHTGDRTDDNSGRKFGGTGRYRKTQST